MRWSRGLAKGVQLGLLAVAIVIVVGHLLGQPILLGYVTTGSMTGTIDPGTGFVAIPVQVAGPIHVGDVVTYRSRTLHPGMLTTHRVVGIVEGGYVTGGDANVVTDQAAGEPPVRRSRIVAVALQLGGHVVTIPYLGAVVTGARGGVIFLHRILSDVIGPQVISPTQLTFLLVAGTGVLYAFGDDARDGRDRTRETNRNSGTDPRVIVFVLTAIVLATLSGVSLATSGGTVVTMDSVSPATADHGGVLAGTNTTRNLTLTNGGVVPMATVIEPTSADVVPSRRFLVVGPRSTTPVPISFRVPYRPGRYQRRIDVYRYPSMLPTRVIAGLYRVDPWAPLLAIDAIVGPFLYVVGIHILGTGRLRDRSRERVLSLTVRIRRVVLRVDE